MARSEHEQTVAAVTEALVLALVVLPVMLFGGNSGFFGSVTNLLGVTLLGLTLYERWRHGNAKPVTRRKLVYDEPWPALALLALFGLVHVIQLLPLPAPIVKILAGWQPETSWARLTPNPTATLWELISWLPPVAVFAAVTLRFDTRRQVRRLLGTLFILAVATSLYGIVETFGASETIWHLPKLAYRGCVTGTFVNRNHFAAFVALGLGAGLALGLYRRSKISGTGQREGGVEQLAMISFAGVIGLVGLLLSRSRGGLGSLLLAGLPVAWLLIGRRHQKAFAAFMIVLAVLTVGMAVWVSQEPLVDRFADLPEEVHTIDARPAAWRAGFRVAARGLVFGTGAGTFSDQFRVTPDTGILVRYNAAHSDPLQIAAETGLVGLFAFIGALFWIIRATVSAFAERQSRFARSMTIGCLAGVAAVLFHSLVDFPLQIPGVRIPLFALLGVAYLAANRRLTR